MKLNCIWFPQPPKKPEPPKPEPPKPEPPKPEPPKPEPPKPEPPKPEPPKPEPPKEPKIPIPPKLPKLPPPEEDIPPTMDTSLTLDTINNTNLKVIAESGAWTSAEKQMDDVLHAKRMDSYIENTLQTHLMHQQKNNMTAERNLGAFIDTMTSLDPIKTVSDNKILNIPTESISMLALGQILDKISKS